VKITLFVTLCFVLGGMYVSVATAAGPMAPMKEKPLKDAYFGETHLHTGVSMDAFIGGNRVTPDDAYRFAKGEENQGQRQRAQDQAAAGLLRGQMKDTIYNVVASGIRLLNRRTVRV
jgi:Protein of unknown function (DUF3604)